MRLRLTHLLLAAGSPAARDGLARATESDARIFVPGWLPCGQCGPCRRGLVAACSRVQEPLAGPPLLLARDLDLPERFLAPIDQPPDAPRIDDTLAACAGAVAEVIEASARAGVGPGELAVWVGNDPRCTLGARWCVSRGCRTFHLQSSSFDGEIAGSPPPPPPPPSAAVTILADGGGLESWREAISNALQAVPHGFVERRIFLGGADIALAASALGLAAPGATITFLRGAVSPITVDTAELAWCRILIGAGRGGYHPDLLPEALAALRAGELVAGDLVAGAGADGAALPGDRPFQVLALEG